jgi:hypothetical protein
MGLAGSSYINLAEPLTNSQSPPAICLSANHRHALIAACSVQSDSLPSVPYAGSPSAEDDSCVVNRASRFRFGRALASNFAQFRHLRRAACAFAAFRWTLTSALGDEFQVPPDLASLCLAEDECPTSFESLLRRLAHTVANLRCLSNLHLPARAGNARFQFATWLPTDGTMRLLNL